MMICLDLPYTFITETPIDGYNVSLNISAAWEPAFYSFYGVNLENKVLDYSFFFKFKQIITRYIKIGNSMDVMRQTARLVCFVTYSG